MSKHPIHLSPRAAAIGLVLAGLATAGCDPGLITDGTPGEQSQTQDDSEEVQFIQDDVVGVNLEIPADWTIRKDPALFETYGFLVFASADAHDEGYTPIAKHSEGAVARVALAYDASPEDLEDLVARKLELYADANPMRETVTLADGREGIAITGLPGTDPYSIVYTTDGENVWEVGLWSAEPGISEKARSFLDKIDLVTPTRTTASLQIPTPEAALYSEPPADRLAESLAESEERRALFEAASENDPDFLLAATQETYFDPPESLVEVDGALAASCGFVAPRSLYWQLQWDRTNRFYSGAAYNLQSAPGWSAMSGNYGSWWGTNYHQRKCSTYYTNQHFANDWPAQRWANAYAAFSGYVEWAGWGTDGFATLGRYVVIRNGRYRNVTAHLTSIAPGISWGKWINGYWKRIGYAGSTGGNWAPHLHSRVSWGESLTYNGQPYGGQSVRPRRLRCFACRDYDVAAAGAGGWYTKFWHGRWMRY